ncbi:MAG: phosphatase PAP2 family protein [Candidatus Protochlamydia sp.]|nr:phosphatase PAP2 family protein [Candidatus Protochlamydia sp.]
MKLKSLLFSLLCCFAASSLTAQNLTQENLVPYFNYSSDDLDQLRKAPPSQNFIRPSSIEKWDTALYSIMQKPLIDGGGARCAAYLYAAQRDAANLTFQLNYNNMGTLDPLSIKVIRLFVPEFRPQFMIESDDYSKVLSNIVFEKVKERFDDEQRKMKNYSEKKGEAFWSESFPILGQRIGSCQPWLIHDIENFRVQTPPSFESLIWLYGLTCIKEAQAKFTPEQIGIINYWAGLKGPESGNWIAILNNYLKKMPSQPFTINQILFLRSIAAMGNVDALIVAFDSKYTFWVKRPHMRDPSIREIVFCPKHPSYPSAHSTVSAAFATLLSHYLPENSEEWRRLAIEAGQSRIWGGLHFVIDNEEGMIQGEKVGRSILNHLQLPSQPLHVTKE